MMKDLVPKLNLVLGLFRLPDVAATGVRDLSSLNSNKFQGTY